jgi:hypothetical protein
MYLLGRRRKKKETLLCTTYNVLLPEKMGVWLLSFMSFFYTTSCSHFSQKEARHAYTAKRGVCARGLAIVGPSPYEVSIVLANSCTF